MNPRSLLFHTCAIGFTVAFWLQAPAAEPALQLRWLETDPKTGDSLLSAIKANPLSPTLRSDPMALSGASRTKQIPSSPTQMAGEAVAHVQADSSGDAKGQRGRPCAAYQLPVHLEGPNPFPIS
jgi:hypothetical protein